MILKKLFLLFISILVLSCSTSSSSDSSYCIKAKFNGTLKEFTYDVVGTFGNDNTTQNVVSFSSVADQDVKTGASGAFPAYELEIEIHEPYGNKAITKANYADAVGSYDERDFTVTSRYVLDGFTRYTNFYNELKDFSITVDRISDTEISGTFRGTISNSSHEDISITAGEFNIPIR